MAAPQYMEEISDQDVSPMPSFVLLIAFGQLVSSVVCGILSKNSYIGWRLVI